MNALRCLRPSSRRAGAWAAVLWLVAHSPSSARTVEPLTVALDMQGINEAGWWRIDGVTLESRAITRLLQEGFSIVPPESPAAIRIRARLQPHGLVIDIVGGKVEGRRVVRLGTTSAELHLEVSQKVVDLARAASRALEAPPPAAPPAPIPSPLAPVPPVLAPSVVEPSPPPAPPARWGGSAVASMLYRPGGIDALGLAELWRRAGRTELLAALAAGPMNSTDVRVLEAQVQVGARGVFRLGDRWEASGGVLVGMALHRFSAPGTPEVPEGTRFDLLVTAPVTLQLRALGPLRVGARLAPGTASRGRRHLAGETELWRRDALRVEAGLVLSLAPASP